MSIIKVIPDPEGGSVYHPIQHERVNLGITSGIQFNEVVLNPTSDAQIDPRVLYWVKYTDLEGWVLVIHYYTKRDPTNLALLDEMVKIFCSSLSPLKGVGPESTSRD